MVWRGTCRYWALILFVGGTMTCALLVMLALVIFESYRAFKFATLYDDVRWVVTAGGRGDASSTCTPAHSAVLRV
jgi:hypothetical protein